MRNDLYHGRRAGLVLGQRGAAREGHGLVHAVDAQQRLRDAGRVAARPDRARGRSGLNDNDSDNETTTRLSVCLPAGDWHWLVTRGLRCHDGIGLSYARLGCAGGGPVDAPVNPPGGVPAWASQIVGVGTSQKTASKPTRNRARDSKCSNTVADMRSPVWMGRTLRYVCFKRWASCKLASLLESDSAPRSTCMPQAPYTRRHA